MKLSKANVRAMFPNHLITFGVEETMFYAKADKKKTVAVARIAVQTNDSLRVFVPMGRTQVLKTFANVNLLKGGRAGIRKAMEADMPKGGRVTEVAIDVVKDTVERDQYRVALELLQQHWNSGVSSHKWEYLTAAAKHEFHYTGTKKPHADAVSPVQQLAETLSKRPRGSKIPQPDEKLTQKIIKQTLKAAEAKPARKPRAKKVTEGQALLMAAGATFDGNGNMTTNPKTPRKPRSQSAAKGSNSAKLNGAVHDAGKWSESDDAAYTALVTESLKLAGRIAQLNIARKRGQSIEAFDKKAQAKRAAK